MESPANTMIGASSQSFRHSLDRNEDENFERQFRYNAQTAPFLCAIFTLRHTVLPHVLRRPAFWLYLAGHIALSVAFRKNFLRCENVLRVADVNIILGLTSFIIVFYANQSYVRYQSLYHQIHGAFQSAHRFSIQLEALLETTSPKHLRLITRWLRASVVLFFTDLGRPVSEDDDSRWSKIVSLELLTSPEREILQPLDSVQRRLLVLKWLMNLTLEALRESKRNDEGPMAVNLISTLTNLDDAQADIWQMHCLPVPFQYFHFLNYMVSILLLLLAFLMAAEQTICGSIVFVHATIIFMGAVELSNELLDPFGNDDVDFPMDAWIFNFLQNDHRISSSAQLDYKASLEDSSRGGLTAQTIHEIVNVTSPSNSSNTESKFRRSVRTEQTEDAASYKYVPLEETRTT